MKWSEYQILISAYIDGYISKQEKNRLLSHLETCSECKETYEALRGIVEGCKQIEEVPLPIDFHETLMKQIKVEDSKKHKLSIKKYCRWQYGGALVASLLVGGVFIQQFTMIKPLSDEKIRQEAYMVSESTSTEDQSRFERSVLNQQGEVTLQSIEKSENFQQDTVDEEMSQVHNKMIIDVVVEDKVQFQTELESFLVEKQMGYEKTEHGYKIKESMESDSLIEWLQNTCQIVYSESYRGTILTNCILEISVKECP